MSLCDHLQAALTKAEADGHTAVASVLRGLMHLLACPIAPTGQSGVDQGGGTGNGPPPGP
jgi:hypothetical protein